MIEIIERIDRGGLPRQIWQPCRDNCGDVKSWNTGPVNLARAVKFYFQELSMAYPDGVAKLPNRFRFIVEGLQVNHAALEALKPITGRD